MMSIQVKRQKVIINCLFISFVILYAISSTVATVHSSRLKNDIKRVGSEICSIFTHMWFLFQNHPT